MEKIFDVGYQFREGRFQAQKAKNKPLLQGISLKEGRVLNILSSTPQCTFSLSLQPNGRAQLQKLDILGHLGVETFGELVLSVGQGKAHNLSLKGANISNESQLSVENLTLRATGTSSIPIGTTTNMQGGQLEVGRQVEVLEGWFENQEYIHAKDGSVFELRGNDFINTKGKYLSKDR